MEHRKEIETTNWNVEHYNIGRELSSKFDDFLAGRSQFDSVRGVDFYAPKSCQSATLVRPLFAFYCPVFFTNKNNK